MKGIWIDDKLHRQLKREAYETDSTIAKIVTDLIKEHFASKPVDIVDDAEIDVRGGRNERI